MAMWGRFLFGINTAAFQQLERTTSWRWPSQMVFGQSPTLQFVGPGDDRITLPGVIYPEWKGGTGQVNAMRAIASTGAPQILLDGRGNILGQWVCKDITETQSNFAGFGIPLKQEFTISLERFPDPISGNVIVNLIANKTGFDLTNIKNMIEQIRNSITQLQNLAQTAKAVVTTAAALIGAPAAIIISSVNKTIRTANSMKDLATNAVTALGVRPTIQSAQTSLGLLTAGLPRLTAEATASAVQIKAAVQTVVDPDGIVAATSALVASNKITAYGSISFHAAQAERRKALAS